MRVEWDFSRLPSFEHGRVIELMQAYKWAELVEIHDRYGLSDNNYCCSNVLAGLKKWYEYGIESGQIKSQGNHPDGQGGADAQAASEV